MIQLNLTLKQAYYLRQLLWNVAGDPKGPRGQMDEICNKLSEHSEAFRELREELPTLDIRGSVTMNNCQE